MCNQKKWNFLKYRTGMISPENVYKAYGGTPEGMETIDTVIRESVQNAFDARISEIPSGITFRLHVIQGKTKEEFINASCIDKILVDRLDMYKLSPNEKFTEAAIRKIEKFKEQDTIRLLSISDYGTTGLKGKASSSRSPLSIMCYQFGVTDKISGKGGSMGFGKTTFITGTDMGMIFVHTISDQGRTFTGTVIHPYHTHCAEFNWDNDPIEFTGIAHFGYEKEDGSQIPLTGDEAKDINREFAQLIDNSEYSFNRKDEELGTDILMVGIDEEITVENLVHSYEKYYFPLSLDEDFKVTFVDESGAVYNPQIDKHPILLKYNDLRNLAKVGDEIESDITVKKINPLFSKNKPIRMGNIAMTIINKDEFNSNNSCKKMLEEVSNSIAKSRGTGMVLNYDGIKDSLITKITENENKIFLAWFETSNIKIKGITVNDIVRYSEPANHTEWDPGSSELRHVEPNITKKQAETLIQRTNSVIDRTVKNYLNSFQEIEYESLDAESMFLDAISEILPYRLDADSNLGDITSEGGGGGEGESIDKPNSSSEQIPFLFKQVKLAPGIWEISFCANNQKSPSKSNFVDIEFSLTLTSKTEGVKIENGKVEIELTDVENNLQIGPEITPSVKNVELCKGMIPRKFKVRYQNHQNRTFVFGFRVSESTNSN